MILNGPIGTKGNENGKDYIIGTDRNSKLLKLKKRKLYY